MRLLFVPDPVGLAISLKTLKRREEVHQPSEHSNDGENHQAYDEQVFHHPLTAFVIEQVIHGENIILSR